MKAHWMRRLWREPFLHFFVLGAAIFALNGVAARLTSPDRRIDITPADVVQLKAQFARTWGREPTHQDLVELQRNLVREEVLYREALASGMDRDDVIVRRRLAQKMDYLATAEVGEPSDAEAWAYYKAHQADYAKPAALSFTQVYFSPDRRRAAAERDAVAALAALKAGRNVEGDPLLTPRAETALAPSAVGRDYGAGVAQALATAPVGQWIGPVRSAYGFHLIRLDARVNASPQAFDAVRDKVRADLANRRLADARDTAFARALRRYDVTFDGRPARGLFFADQARP